ncbi:MAG: hypothetical protein U1E76_25625 [Planctomycetota bacterium]
MRARSRGKLNVSVGNMIVGVSDGEIEAKIHDDIRGADVFIVQPDARR